MGVKEQHVKFMAVRLYGLLAGLALLSLCAYWMFMAVLASYSASGVLVNVSGRQRMLSQRVLVLGLEMAHIGNGKRRDEKVDEIRRLVEQMRISHEGLMFGSAEYGLSHVPSRAVRGLFEGPEGSIDRHMKVFLKQAAELAEPDGRQMSELETEIRVLAMSREVDALLPELDALTHQFQLEGDEYVKRLSWVNAGTLTVSWLLLGSCALWMLRPLFQKMREDDVRRKEDELSIRKLVHAVDFASTGILITNSAGIIEHANPHFARMAGWRREELKGQKPRAFRSGHTESSVYVDLWKELRCGREWRGRFLNRRPSGETYWTETAITPVLDDSKAISNYIAVATDITDRLRKDQALEDALVQAEKASAGKSEFIAHVSHELRTPLNAIMGFAQVVLIDEVHPVHSDHVDSLERILRAGHHSMMIIGELMDRARVESGKISLHFESIDPATLMQDVFALSSGLAGKAGIRLTLNSADEPKPLIRADFTRLKQVLLNLVSNAIKYNHPGGEVVMSCVQPDCGCLRFLVADDGDGIPADRCGELFKPFSRLGRENGAKEGVGIGLAISEQLVRLMDGQIGFSSEAGQGSCFWVELPVVTEHRPLVGDLSVAETADRSASGGQATTVLCIENDPGDMVLVELLVRQEPLVHLLKATSVRQGVDLAVSNPVHIILLGEGVLKAERDEVLSRLMTLSECGKLPVVLIGRDAANQSGSPAAAFQADAFLRKPVTRDDIRELLRRFFSTDAQRA